MTRRLRLTLVTIVAVSMLTDARPAAQSAGNRSDRLEWFRDLGFGLFIHWSLDSQIGSVISHSLVGADAGYLTRHFDLLPRAFNPRHYRPEDWAVLAKLAGMKYVVFTTKHHSGFCMYDTTTTPFSVMNTPYGRDVTAELVNAFRAQGLAIGFYFSPDDFHYLHTKGKVIDRAPRPGVTPKEVPGLLEHDQAQLRELLTRYGPIDIMFLDGPAEGLRELCWQLQPDVVVTRGAIETPEQRVPGVAIDRPWESCITMGTAWQYKPTHEQYKSGTQLIELLIETRAKGGSAQRRPEAGRRAGDRAGGAPARDRALESGLRRVDRRRASLGDHQRGRRLVHEAQSRRHRLRLPDEAGRLDARRVEALHASVGQGDGPHGRDGPQPDGRGARVSSRCGSAAAVDAGRERAAPLRDDGAAALRRPTVAESGGAEDHQCPARPEAAGRGDHDRPQERIESERDAARASCRPRRGAVGRGWIPVPAKEADRGALREGRAVARDAARRAIDAWRVHRADRWPRRRRRVRVSRRCEGIR
jgi:hypothetical protein